MLILIDNYDSFTYNLYQYCATLGYQVEVFRNDQITIQQLEQLPLKAIIISPGPGRPEQAGISTQVVAHFHKKIPILGICLGHQCIGQYFGAKVVHAKQVMHGKISKINHNGQGVFQGLDQVLEVMRYHSLTIEEASIKEQSGLAVYAKTIEDDEVMAISHKEWPIWGYQFHPESIGTPCGMKLLEAFFKEVKVEAG